MLYRRILALALTRYARLSGDSSLLMALRHHDYEKLLRLAGMLSGTVYPTANLQFASMQVASLIKKYPWNPESVKTDPEAAAKRSFRVAENRCARMNKWFQLRRIPRKRRRMDEMEYYLEKMRAFIKYVLRDVPNFASIYQQADYTGGAAIGVHGDATNLLRKLTAKEFTVTPTCIPYVAACLSNNFHYSERFAKDNGVVRSFHVSENDVAARATYVSANKIAFVPKTAETYRSIAVEPLGNGLVQKGIDLEMRKLLRRVNIDLSDQSRNQRMALLGSFDGSEDFVTIDLKSASDSISLELCREILPPDWFNFLNRVRSPSYIIDGIETRYHKFCSMGNGFCFPLETLIFAAVCSAVQAGHPGKDFSVYGDDIIVRKPFGSIVVNLLKRLGFKTNVRKTFLAGPFRESCGSNWYSGEDVTPFTLDFALDSLSSIFKFLNLSRRNDRTTVFLDDMRRLVLNRLPDRFQFWRPFKGAPDTGIDPAGFEFTPRYWKRVKHTFSWRWLELESRPLEDTMERPSWVVMAAALRGHTPTRMFTYRRKTVTRLRVTGGSGDLIPSEHNLPRIWKALQLRYSRYC